LISTIEQSLIKVQAEGAARTCFDPEIPVNIFELGLIYDIKCDEEGNVNVDMTLTSPSCPAAQTIPKELGDKIGEIPSVKTVKVHVVWDPPWDKEMMSEAAKLELGFF